MPEDIGVKENYRTALNVFEGRPEDSEVTEVTPVFTNTTWGKLTSKLSHLIDNAEAQRVALGPQRVALGPIVRDEKLAYEPLRALCKFDDERVLVEYFLEISYRLNARCTWIRSVKVATPPVKCLSMEFGYCDYAHHNITHRCQANQALSVRRIGHDEL